MALTKYKEKRDFSKSPEPTGGKPDSEKLRFVIQKHDASHLHYDFRLEMEGVLKSWAVPKGPSTDPEVKRLAMMVEDHPYDYRTFEGIIPSGYGAGTVMVWDEGFYEPYESKSKDKKTGDKELKKALHSGKLKFILHGKKLKGAWALVKAHGRGDNGWLLMKIEDEYASKEDITKKDKSVVSKKTLPQIEKTSTNYWGSHKPAKNGNKKVSGKKPIPATLSKSVSKAKKNNKKLENDKTEKKSSPIEKNKLSADVEQILKKAKKEKFPAAIKPMLATLVDKPFEKDGWLYEIKWDGYRAMALLNKGTVELKSRNDKSFNEKFYPVVAALKKLSLNVVLDGEIVVTDEKGIPDFGALQNWRSEADGELMYYVFDIMWLDGKDLTPLPLVERRAVLESFLKETDTIQLSKAMEESGLNFFDAAKEMGLEGIIAKKAASAYLPGLRTNDWLKIKANKRQEMVIGGYTKNDDTSKAFSSLLVGVMEKGELIYTGKVGTGFNKKTQDEMMKQFKKYEVKKCPFKELPDINKPSRFRPNPPNATATFLKPVLVCEVSYAEMTSDGIMRHPSFEGMRTDKKASDVMAEKEKSVEKVVEKKDTLSEKKMIVPAGKKERKTFLNPKDETQVRLINGNEIKFTNLSKIFFPKEKVTKRDVLNYYYQVAPYILPYLKDRPQSMLRHPNGIEGESFFFKDVTGKAPSWIETYEYHSDADDRTRNYLVAKDDASLLYMISLGCIEVNPWHSTVHKEDYPDWCIIDLDPATQTFVKVIEAAQVTKSVLDAIGVPSYPKTSGSKGIHIYIPLGAKYTYEQSKEFARVIARLVHEQTKKFTSIERAVKDRSGKMYIDFLQNRPQATVSAPYSLRPKPGATVSMPLHWEEVKKGLKMTDFTIFNAMDRIKSEGDIFKPVIGKGIDLNKAISKFEELK